MNHNNSLSYRFPVFETPAGALCGTTGKQIQEKLMARIVSHCHSTIAAAKTMMARLVGDGVSGSFQVEWGTSGTSRILVYIFFKGGTVKSY